MKRNQPGTYFNSDWFINPYTIHTARKDKQIADLQDKIRRLLPKPPVSRYIANREIRPNYYNRDYLLGLEAVRDMTLQIEALNSGSYNDPFDELYIPPPRYVSTDRYPSKSNLGGKKKSKKLNLKKKTKKSKKINKINKINKTKKLIKQKKM